MTNESTKRDFLPQDVHNDLLRYGINVEASSLECIELSPVTQASQEAVSLEGYVLTELPIEVVRNEHPEFQAWLERASRPVIPVRQVAYG